MSLSLGSEITDCFLLHLVQTKLAELRAKSKYRHCNETKLKGVFERDSHV